MKVSNILAGATAAAASKVTAPNTLNISSIDSIKDVASTLAFNTMSYYQGNVSGNPLDVGDVIMPYYWWTAGALWGAMLDYYHYTKDTSYNDVIIQALQAPANLGADKNYVPADRSSQEGNDDLFFWGSAAISAAERNFPQPNATLPSWLDLGANVFNSLVSRWDTTSCGGGLLWQIYASNPNGLTYKNSVSNGGLFQIAARMARATKNETYLEWAEKVWDWSWNVSFIDHSNYHVYDGAGIQDNCAKVNQESFTYTSGIYLYGAAVLANYTGQQVWAERAANLLDGAGWFFSPFSNSTNVMYEGACEPTNNCDDDMRTFKGYLARFMWQSSLLQPSLQDKVKMYLDTSANAAAHACSGSTNGTLCGERWYVGGYDGTWGFGQNMCAMETVQGLLVYDSSPPLTAEEIKVVRDMPWAPSPTTRSVHSAASQSSKPTKTGAGSVARPDAMILSAMVGAAAMVAFGMA